VNAPGLDADPRLRRLSARHYLPRHIGKRG